MSVFPLYFNVSGSWNKSLVLVISVFGLIKNIYCTKAIQHVFAAANNMTYEINGYISNECICAPALSKLILNYF